MIKLVFILLTIVAASRAGYAVVETYADANCNTTLLARFITTDPQACAMNKRFVAQTAVPSCNLKLNVHAYYDYSYCSSTSEPVFPSGWQVVQLTADSSCNATAGTTSWLGVPEPLSGTEIAIFNSQVQGVAAANTTLVCLESGDQEVSTCIDYQGTPLCANLSLQNNVCHVDNTGANYGLQTTCVAVPVAVPIIVVSEGPIASPVKSTNSPAKTSSATSFLYGSAAFVSLIALI